MNRILLSASEMDESRIVLNDVRAKHIHKVLKAAPDQALRIGLIDGPKGLGRVVSCDDAGVALDCDFENKMPDRPPVNLILAMPRPKVLKRLWAQLAALGVGKVILINASKVEKNYWDTHIIDENFYRDLLIEGLQQAGDTRLPEVDIQRAFRPWVEDTLPGLSEHDTKLLAYERDAVRLEPMGEHGNTWLAIGPEGGWNDFEVQLFREQGFTPFSLGSRILRSDTACVAALALVHQKVGS